MPTPPTPVSFGLGPLFPAALPPDLTMPLLFLHSPVSPQRDDMEAVPGYLSLHQTADGMTLKWTPNQLMNGSVGDLDYEKR